MIEQLKGKNKKLGIFLLIVDHTILQFEKELFHIKRVNKGKTCADNITLFFNLKKNFFRSSGLGLA